MDYCLYQNSASKWIESAPLQCCRKWYIPFLTSPRYLIKEMEAFLHPRNFFQQKMKVNVPKPVSL